MARPKTKEYVTFSFKCLAGRDDDLIKLLQEYKADRSRYIRDHLRLALDMSTPSDPQVVDLETLRAELNAAVDTILENLPRITFPAQRQSEPQTRARRDVNDRGKNIPDF